MPDQPTPKPLTAEEVDDALTAEYAYTDKTIQRLWKELLASRAETAALRESLAAAEKQRDEHFQAKLSERAIRMVAEANEETFKQQRDALAAELAEARKMLDDIDRKAHGFGIGSDNQRLHGICDILAARASAGKESTDAR